MCSRRCGPPRPRAAAGGPAAMAYGGPAEAMGVEETTAPRALRASPAAMGVAGRLRHSSGGPTLGLGLLVSQRGCFRERSANVNIINLQRFLPHMAHWSNCQPRLLMKIGVITVLGTMVWLFTMKTVQADVVEPSWSYSTTDNVYSVSISADGTYIAAGTRDDGICLFERNSSTPLWSNSTTGPVLGVAISADGRYIAAGGYNHNFYLFESNNSSPLWSYHTGNNVGDVAISADGEYIAVGPSDNNIYLFQRNNSTPLWTYNMKSIVTSVDISSDGAYIAAGTKNGGIYLFQRNSSTPLWNYTQKSEDEYSGYPEISVAISADGEYIAAGSRYNKVYIFDKSSSTPQWNYTTGDEVLSVDISADGKYIAAGSREGQIYLFDKNSSTPHWNYTTGDQVWSVAISTDGEYITAGSVYNSIYLFNNSKSTPLWSYTIMDEGRQARISSVTIAADGRYVVAGTGRNVNNVYLMDDRDGDGFWGESDAFIEDPAASLDSDGDGYPDAWNIGKSEADSTTGLILDDDYIDENPTNDSIITVLKGSFNIAFVILIILTTFVVLCYIGGWKRENKLEAERNWKLEMKVRGKEVREQLDMEARQDKKQAIIDDHNRWQPKK